MAIRRRFPHIEPRIFLRTDIWEEMNFTNKSHLLDKKIELDWSRSQLSTLLLKRACTGPLVREFVSKELGVSGSFEVEDLVQGDTERALAKIFPETAYSGKRESKIMDWIEARVTDGRGTVLPRESIRLGNLAKEKQVQIRKLPPDALISREAIRDAFESLSRERKSSFLAEFAELQPHIEVFRGKTSATFTRKELQQLFSSLQGKPDEAIERLYEIGVLHPDHPDAKVASSFEIPRLYRVGLGLVLRGRL